MPSCDTTVPARQAISSALTRIQRRLSLNRVLYESTLVAGLVVLVLAAWRALRWLGDALPAATALVVLAAILGGVALLFLLAASLLTRSTSTARAAAEADRRASLKDELASACWFMRQPDASEWVGAQLQRAARTARGLEPARLIPLRVPAPALAALAVAFAVLAGVWAAPRLVPAHGAAVEAALAAEREQIRALREFAGLLPDSEAGRKLEEALALLESVEASDEQRRTALAQAHDAVEQIRLQAASARDALQRAGSGLRGQEGMGEVAEALAAGDGARAAELLAQLPAQAPAAESPGTSAGPPVPGGAGDKSLEQVIQEAVQGAGAADERGPSAAPRQEAIDRLSQIARELAAANNLNEAWREVRGAQLSVAQRSALSAARFAQQTQTPGMPAPDTGETPMGGGVMFGSAVVAQGPGQTEQEAGMPSGDAVGDAPADALLGASGERLEAQLELHGIASGNERPDQQDQEWFYAESQEQKARAQWRDVQARARFAQAEAASNDGISIQHRQIVKDYFMMSREETR
jgi:hypothetical protein